MNEQPTKHEITKCDDCPFAAWNYTHAHCTLDASRHHEEPDVKIIGDLIPENCPLKRGSHLVVLK